MAGAFLAGAGAASPWAAAAAAFFVGAFLGAGASTGFGGAGAGAAAVIVGGAAWRGGCAAVFFFSPDSHADNSNAKPMSGMESNSLGFSIYLLRNNVCHTTGTTLYIDLGLRI